MKYLRRLLLVLLATATVLLGQWGSAFGQTQTLSFDHTTTGFFIDSTHKQVGCESCHTSGIFRGTPRTCATCHAGPGARAPGKPATHIPAMAACDTCHRPGASSWSEKPTGFTKGGTGHPIDPLLGVTATNCQTCHNGAFLGANALTKPAVHIRTSKPCSTCHITTSWTPATNPHEGVVPGSCANCHNGTNAPGKKVGHIPTSASCDTCHGMTFAAFKPARMNHASATGEACATCHGGAYTTQGAQAKSAAHILVSGACDTCHKNSSFLSWSPSAMDHTGLTQCSTCHSGSYLAQNAQQKPPTHQSTNAQCSGCHKSTKSWAPATQDHSKLSPPAVIGDHSCNACHNGTPNKGLAKPGTHVPTTGYCDSCHKGFASFTSVSMNHTGTTGQCSTCHNATYAGKNALPMPSTHIKVTEQCDTCHKSGYQAWSPATMDHAQPSVKAQSCATCHSGAYLSQNAQQKPTTHQSTNAPCSDCHKSTTSWATVTQDHSKLSPPVVIGDHSCATNCHNGTVSKGLSKPSTHIPTTAACDTCHSSFSAFAPASMSHAGTAGACASCHGGGYTAVNAQAKTAKHIPTTQSCDVCHATTAWKPTNYSHQGLTAGSCATCHNGTNATGKMADHIPTTAACDTCHTNFNAFSPAQMNHTGLDGQCSTCHSGRYSSQKAQSKPVTHIPTQGGAQCDSCHHSTTSWATVTFDHGNPALRPPTSKCTDCHNGTTAGLGKPSYHVPTSATCDTCHTNFNAFKPAQMNHASTAGQCTTCHSGGFVSVNAQVRSGRHIPTDMQCDSCHSSGFVAWSPARMNHAGLGGQCASCHSGGYLPQNAQTKTSTHIGTTLQCDTCHASTTTWATGVFNHASAVPAVAGRCSSCHTGLPNQGVGKPTNHIPTSAQCDSCHKTFAGFSTVTMNHAGTAGKCATCHAGDYVFANALAKTAVHIPTKAQCDTCHTGSFSAWSPAVMNHTGLAGQCSTCHGGANVSQNAQTKPATHVSTNKQCDTCHGTTTSWATVKYKHDSSAFGNCSNCHGSVALSKPSTHIPTSAQCDSCHNNFDAFKPAVMKHGLAGESSCITCHGGAYVSQNALAKPSRHIQTTAACDSCHGNTYVSWATVSFSHTPANIQGKACADCHNGVSALGKPSAHIPTSASCDTCHGTTFTAFKSARMNHATATGEACVTCHGGAYTTQGAQAKSATHIPVSGACDTCHKNSSFLSWSPSAMDHTGLTQCATCHSGSHLAQNAQQKPTTHQSTNAQCSDCHKSTTSWATVTQDHSKLSPPAVIGDHSCNACHNGTPNKGLAKPGTHIPTSGYCDTCHKGFASFVPASMDHSGLTGQCSTCHGGGYTAQNALTKPATHVTTTAQCDTCHGSTSSWTSVAYVHDAGAYGKCSTCHNGSTALGVPGGHIPTGSQQCSDCHQNFVAFKPARMNHAQAVGQCSTCHNATYASKNALPMPSAHIKVTEQCDTCHKSGYVAWSPATMDHQQPSVKAQSCATCHSGAYLSQNAQQKPSTHQSTSAPCSDCHKSTTTWATVTQDHSKLSPPAVIGDHRCTSCHNGTPNKGLAKPSTHIPTTAACDTCHSNFSAFAPASMSHAGTAGACASCHGGGYAAVNAQAKSATHIPTTQSCDVCHATTAWKPTSYSHQGVTAGSCATCHNGSNATGKSTSHIPTTAACDSCHKNYTAFSPAKMNHTGQTQCATCHSGAYLSVNAQTKPTTHQSTTAQCSDCHKSTTSWATATQDHTKLSPPAVIGDHSCNACHNGTPNKGLAKPGTHIPTSGYCDTCHKGFASFALASMDHTGLTGQCSTCHSGGYVSQNAQQKPVTHQATTAQCSDCHKSTTSWATVRQDHAKLSPPAVIGDHSCATSCHNGTANKGLAKPATHIPTTAACDTCHTNFTAFAPALMSHTGTAGTCSTCHNATYAGKNALPMPSAHIKVTEQCDTCHKSGYLAWSSASMDHTQPSVKAQSCATCHSGAYLSQNAQQKPSTHQSTSAPCSDCHKSTKSWATVAQDHSKLSPPAVIGDHSCATNCHNGTANKGLAKPTTHIPTAAACDTCHSNFSAFAPASMSHASTAGACASCHGGGYTAVNAQAKSATHILTTQSCDVCHTTTAWKPASYSHQGVTTGTCAGCHNGTNARGASASHIPTTAACDSCHKNYASFAPAQMNHSGLAGLCSTCHSGTYTTQKALAKPAGHVSTTAQCDTCHGSTSSWASVVYAHDASAYGKCSTCHNGSTALGLPGGHIPTGSQQCSTCHKNFVAFKPAQMNHVLTVGLCSTCHNATYAGKNALPMPSTHIKVTEQCDTCHKSGYVAWSPAAMDHTQPSVKAQTCATCHSGAYLSQNAQQKPSTHQSTSAPCSDCHKSTTSWATVTQDHSKLSPPAVIGDHSCATNCHNGTANKGLAKPTTHVPSSAACDTCHANFSAFAPASMSHAGTAGACASCHGGAYTAVNAQAKSAKHIPTTQSCDVCHATTAWKPTSYSHQGVTAGSCATCHNGTNATGKSTSHIPTSAACDSCHKNYTAFAPARMNHSGLTGQCATCHGGSYLAANAQVKPATHVATSAQCDTCHSSTTSWATATYVHAATATGTCDTCHGKTALGKPTNHLPTSAQCDTCHGNFSAFKPAAMNHTATAGKCSWCHSGNYLFANALAKPSAHVPVTDQCDACHKNGYVTWSPATMDHTLANVVSQGCSTCHSGSYVSQNAQQKPATHQSTTAQCSDCHKTTSSWATATQDHSKLSPPAVIGDHSCNSCHNGTPNKGLAKPATHIPTSAACDTCHTTFTAFAPAAMNHTGTAGACATCHGGGYTALNAQAKPSTHIVTTQSCDTCHATTAWKPVTYSHTGVTAGSCATCHNGSNALGKSAAHIPTSAACDTCHKNYVAFSPAQMNHTGLAGQCATCHGGSYVSVNAQSKSSTHVSTTAQCDICHSSTTSWATATFVHANPPGVCATCHNGSKAVGKPTNHIPTSAACDTCHKNQLTFKPAQMDHAGLAGQCTTCHSGAYIAVNALAKPTSHIPVTGQCDTCHSKGFSTWSPSAMVHSSAMIGQCSTCHGGAYLSQNAQTKPTSHSPTTAQCDSCHTSTSTWATATQDHSKLTPVVTMGDHSCSTNCHNGAANKGLAKPTTHIPTTGFCDNCHKNFTAFAPATMSHSGTSSACATCHGGAYVTLNAQAKPSTHLPTTQSCDVCHGTTVWKPTTFAHQGVVAGSCATCHNGTNALGKNLTHIPTSLSCDTCHKTSDAAFAPANKMTHTSAMTGQCSTCHGGSHVAVNALAKPTSHVSTTAQCDTCHASTTTWTTGRYVHPVTAAGTCSNCHNGSVLGAQSKQSAAGGHIPTTAQCDTCHKNYTAFAPATMSHTGTASACSSCHSGAYVKQNALAKPVIGHVTTAAQCDTCHISTVDWKLATFVHPANAAGSCTNCHNGSVSGAQTKPTTHLATSSQCDVCHRTTAWSPTSFAHTAAQMGTSTCANCHNGSTASGKPSLHIPSSEACSVCHRTGVAWLPVVTPYPHNGVAAGACTNCHKSSYPGMDYQPAANHVPTTAACDACHNKTDWATVTSFTHVGVATCQSCHSGIYVGIKGKHAKHVPTTLSGLLGNECSNCHSSRTSFTVEKMNHGSIQTGCKSCHNSPAVYDTGTADLKRLGSHEGSKASDDCSQSGCHKPLGKKGAAYTKWD